MVVGVARVVLHMPASRSLKEKRQVIRSVVAQTQRRLQIAVAEVDEQDRWQIAVLGLACISNSPSHADEVLAHAVRFIATHAVDAQLVDYETEIIHAM